ncbi:peptidase S24 [Flavobacterium psychrophilum]|uniref:peptidase S24 n=1 Tax=Flavobacterium psychrophilum TaxID=96345 RepID=UPI001ABD188B|nr:peptidase S24 [Flavobacterium psychrophilum]
MGTTERVNQYIDYKGISKYKFCKDLGFSNKFLDNSSNMGTDKACKILHHYPEINSEWLLTGQGSMLKSETITAPVIQEDAGKIAMLERENAMQAKVIAGLERENQLLREARETNQDKSKPSDVVATSVGSKL